MAVATATKLPMKILQASLLGVVYFMLYAPIFYMMLCSFSANASWPFPLRITFKGYHSLFSSSLYTEALFNSFILSICSGLVAGTLAVMAGIAVLKYRSKWRIFIAVSMLSPIFVAQSLIGIANMAFNWQALGITGNFISAVLANAVWTMSFAFLVVLSQLVRYNWRLDDAAMVFGASPWRCFREITLPICGPAIGGAYVTAFILTFVSTHISFYTLGATPLFSIALLYGGVDPEKMSLASLANLSLIFLSFIVFLKMYRNKRREKIVSV